MRTKTPVQAEKMLEAAARLFSAHRFHEVRMEDIAAEAEVGKGTIYRYFPDKEELYLALLRRASEQLLSRVQEVKEEAHTARERLEAIVAAVIGYFDAQPHILDLIQRAEVLQRGTSPWQQTRVDFTQMLIDVFVEARARGELMVCDPELAALMLLGALRSVIRFGKHPRPADLAQRVVADFLHGVDRRCQDLSDGKQLNGTA